MALLLFRQPVFTRITPEGSGPGRPTAMVQNNSASTGQVVEESVFLSAGGVHVQCMHHLSSTTSQHYKVLFGC